MQVLGWLMYPLVAAWAVYSLVYHHHRSWWSWLIRAMANGVYLWGFIAMTPQLYINYRLKSVAHLPWRSFMYKVRVVVRVIQGKPSTGVFLFSSRVACGAICKCLGSFRRVGVSWLGSDSVGRYK